LSFSTNTQDGHAYGRVAGEWLRRFHGLALHTEQSSDLFEKITYVEGRLAQLPACDRILTESLHLLKMLAPQAGAVPLPVSWAFGDFKSDNLLIDAGRVLALDVQLLHENAVIFNVAQFLVHLELLRWVPRGLIKHSVLTATADSFLRAYAPATGDWHLPIAWLQTEMLLQRCINIAQPKGIGDRIRNAIALRALARSCNSLAHWQ
jgi:hypothetical protein